MRVTGYCSSCRRVRTVTTSLPVLEGASVGICSQCQDDANFRSRLALVVRQLANIAAPPELDVVSQGEFRRELGTLTGFARGARTEHELRGEVIRHVSARSGYMLNEATSGALRTFAAVLRWHLPLR